MNKIKLVCFDLDGTLVQEIHSVMFLCILNGKLDELMQIEAEETEGMLNWIDADYRKAVLLQGLEENKLHDGFDHILKPLKNIASVVETLRHQNMHSIIITAGPRQVARAVKEKWNFDACEGSDYEMTDGVFTGKILHHLGDTGKVDCLQRYCNLHGIGREECAAVGDGLSDVALFAYCGTSIALNAAPAIEKRARYHLRTVDLNDILQYI